MRRPPFTIYLFTLIAASIGGWMAVDGLRARMFGDFARINGQLGTWAAIPNALGIEPLTLGFFFVVLGLEWIAAACGLWLRRRWGYNLALGLSLVTLFYAFIGTGFSALALVLLLVKPTKTWMQEAGSRK